MDAFEVVTLAVLGSIPARHLMNRGVLLGEQTASKTVAQGSNPCAPATFKLPVWLDTERRRTRNAVDVGANPTAGSRQVSGVRSQESDSDH